MEKLTFSIEEFDYEDISDSQFAEFSMDVCTTGDNTHHLYISEEVMMAAKDSLVGKPILAKYSRYTNDATTHEKDEVPLGYIPSASDITIEVKNGKPWIVAKGRIWKLYAKDMLEVLRRRKEVSVSMEIEAIVEKDAVGRKSIESFIFAGVTILGRSVNPSIAGAKLSMLTFAEMQKALVKENFAHKYSQLDFIIPASVKEQAQKGLDLSQEYELGGTSNNLAWARYLKREDSISYEKARKMFDTVKTRYSNVTEENPPSDKFIASCMWGGEAGRKWIKDLVDKMNELDKEQVAMFSKKEIDESKDSVDESAREGGKPVDNFEEEVKKDEEVATEEVEAPEDKEKETETEVEVEVEVEDKKEEEAENKDEKEKEFSDEIYVEPAAKAWFLAKETEVYRKLVDGAKNTVGFMKEELKQVNWAELKDEDEENLQKAHVGMSEMIKPFFEDVEEKEDDDDEAYMFAALCKYAKVLDACYSFEKKRADGLQKFKDESMEQKKFAQVEELLFSVHEDLVKEDETEFREFAKTMDINDFDSFANRVRAKAYEGAKAKGGNTRLKNANTVQKFATPWVNEQKVDSKKKGLWEK